MSGGIKRLRLSDGTIANVPEDQLKGFLLELDRSGVQFDVTEEAAPAKSAAVFSPPEGIEPQPNPDDHGGLLEQFLATLRSAPSPGNVAARPAAQAMGAGFEHGVSLGAAQNLPGGVGDLVREGYDGARAASPPLYAAGDVAGAVAAPMPGGPGRGIVDNAVRQGAIGAAQGGIRHYSDDPDHDPLEALVAGGEAGGLGAAIGGGLGTAGWAAGKVAGAGNWLGARARTAAYGAGKHLEDLGMTPDQFAAETDRLGLNNMVVPQTPGMKLDRVLPGKEAAGARIGGATAAADEAGVAAGTQWGPKIAKDLYQKADETMAGQFGDDPSQAAAYSRVAHQVEKQPTNTLTDLRALKTGYEGKAYKGIAGSDESMMGIAHQEAADRARGYLRGGMAQAAPDVQQAFNAGNRDYGSLSTLEELLRGQRSADEMGAPALARGAAGALTGSPWTVAQSMGRSAGGLTADAVANASYGVSNLASGARSMANGAAQMGGVVGGLAGGASKAQAQEHVQQSMSESRGYLLPDVIEKLAYSDPEALGPYKDKFVAALEDPNGSRVSAVLTDLQQSDPQFRTQWLPMWQRMTTGGR